MKKFVVFIVSLALMLNLLGVALSAVESDVPVPETPVGIEVLSVNGRSTFENITVYAGNRFSITFMLDVVDFGGRVTATVSGSGFTVDGSVDSRDFDEYEGTYLTLPVFVDSSVPTGRHAVTLSVEYDVDGVKGIASKELNINVVGSTEVTPPDDSNGNVTLNITSAPSAAVSAGDTFEVGFSSSLNAIYSALGYGASGVLTVSGDGFSLAGAYAEQNVTSGANLAEILVDSKAEAGRKQVTLTVTYTVGAEKYSASRTLNIDVTNGTEEVDESKDSAAFRLASASIPESKGRANLATKLSLSFENTTDFTAENVKITLSGLGDVILNTYTDTVDVGTVAGKEKVNATFPIKFPEKVLNPQTTLDFTVSYDTPAGHKDETFHVYLQATVTKEDEETPESATLTPKVIISQYSVDVEEVVSGEEFTLSFTLENTSTEKDLRNMTVNVIPQAYTSSTGGTSSGPVFSFIDGTSSFYTDLLEKSGTLEYSIRLKCSASAGAGSYPIEINYNFEYANGGGYSSGNGEMDINLPVKQPVKFDLLDWIPPTECGLDGTMISFQYFNKSRNPMTNLTISMEGDFDMPPQSVATLNASNADYFNGMITPKAGAQVGDVLHAVLVFTFEDAAGEEQRKEETFDVTVTDSSPMDGMGGDMAGDWTIDYTDPSFGMDPGVEYDENGMPVDGSTVQQGGLPLWAKIAIPSAAVVAAIVAAVVIAKKVKAKKAAQADEDDDEE